jgi:probable HAF family extracellular repeat protein
MTKQNWLFALLIGSSIGCFCGADKSPAQSLSSLKYRLQVLPNEGGLSFATSINNRDWIAGPFNPPNDLSEHAGLVRRNEDSQSGNQSWRLNDLGTLGGTNSGVGVPNKNEIGWLAGASNIAVTDPYAENFCGFICTTPTCPPTNLFCRGFLRREETNKMIALPPLPGGSNSKAQAANNNHQIAGFAETGVMEPSCGAPQVFLYQGVVWALNASGAPVIEKTLPPITGDIVSVAIGINDFGIVVGASGACGPPEYPAPSAHAVLWKNGQARDLGSLGGVLNNFAQVVNNKGWVVGGSDISGDTVQHAFLWQEATGMKDLGTLFPDDTASFSFAQSVNNRGEVVGFSCAPSGPPPIGCSGFYWRNRVMIDLRKHLTQPSSVQILVTGDINDSGEITAVAFDPNFNGGDNVSVLLVPEQDEQNSQGQNSQRQSATANSPLSLSGFPQRLSPVGPWRWRIAR